jgi:hypothetical protein
MQSRSKRGSGAVPGSKLRPSLHDRHLTPKHPHVTVERSMFRRILGRGREGINRGRGSRTLVRMRELLRTRHYVVTLDQEARLLRRVRSAEPFASVADIEAAYAELGRAIDEVDRARYTQLVDSRLAPPRNDPEFEETVARHHATLYGGFLASAILVQSAVGRLHVKRMLEASGVDVHVFSDEGEATEYLAQAVRQSRKP